LKMTVNFNVKCWGAPSFPRFWIRVPA
jgi:hypothetical protein